jgi:predicted DNA-binding transcriptional regulator AlpA
MPRLTVEEAAKYVRLSKGTLNNLRTAGGGPRFIKLGRVFYDVRDLDQWIDAHKQSSTADKPELRRRRRRRINNLIDVRR